MRNVCSFLLFLVTFAISSQADAYPQALVCIQQENFGEITVETIKHGRAIVMKLAPSPEGTYVYTGVAKNKKDDGGGQTASATYDVNGNFIGGTYGISCPLQIPY